MQLPVGQFRKAQNGGNKHDKNQAKQVKAYLNWEIEIKTGKQKPKETQAYYSKIPKDKMLMNQNKVKCSKKQSGYRTDQLSLPQSQVHRRQKGHYGIGLS